MLYLCIPMPYLCVLWVLKKQKVPTQASNGIYGKTYVKNTEEYLCFLGAESLKAGARQKNDQSEIENSKLNHLHIKTHLHISKSLYLQKINDNYSAMDYWPWTMD